MLMLFFSNFMINKLQSLIVNCLLNLSYYKTLLNQNIYRLVPLITILCLKLSYRSYGFNEVNCNSFIVYHHDTLKYRVIVFPVLMAYYCLQTKLCIMYMCMVSQTMIQTFDEDTKYKILYFRNETHG